MWGDHTPLPGDFGAAKDIALFPLGKWLETGIFLKYYYTKSFLSA